MLIDSASDICEAGCWNQDSQQGQMIVREQVGAGDGDLSTVSLAPAWGEEYGEYEPRLG